MLKKKKRNLMLEQDKSFCFPKNWNREVSFNFLFEENNDSSYSLPNLKRKS